MAEKMPTRDEKGKDRQHRHIGQIARMDETIAHTPVTTAAPR
jgi:hypothetical protein